MSFATDYVAQLEAVAAEGRLPRIRALHLPPVRPVHDNRGEFCALELEDGSLGLSYVLLDDTLARLSSEVDELGRAFARACNGSPSLMLVAGYSGVGKTSLIQELYRPIAGQRGNFISGKFDQVVRNIPFGALIQALRGLVQQLPTGSEESLTRWAGQLEQALGANGGVYTDVEKTMIELQHTTIVQETRSAFQNAMQQKFISAVERLSE